jgi:hypothetical protein
MQDIDFSFLSWQVIQMLLALGEMDLQEASNTETWNGTSWTELKRPLNTSRYWGVQEQIQQL